MEDEKITLDMKSFKALASDSRVSILKSLKRRRKMLTELSKELKMSPSTVKEHLDSLSGAGLVVQIDDGHKWKYYELTRAGKDILNPDETRVWVVLGLSAIALVVTSWDLIRTAFGDWGIRGAAKTFAGDMFQSLPMNEAAEGAADAASNGFVQAATQIPYPHIIAIGLFAAIFGISVGYMLARRKWIQPI
jgi:DNA-binding transcriptional ArsR family regulator